MSIFSKLFTQKEQIPDDFTPTMERLILLTGNHDEDFRTAHALYSKFSKHSEQCDQKLKSIQLNSPEGQKIFQDYIASVTLALEAGLLVNAIAPKAYGQPDLNRVLTPDELRRAQTFVDALCRKFVSFFQLSRQSDCIKGDSSKQEEYQRLEEAKKKAWDDVDALTDKITKIYWATPSAVLVDTDTSEEKLEELREKIKKLELENKVLSKMSQNHFVKNSQLQKQIVSYRHAIEEKDATISVLKKRLDKYDRSAPFPDGHQVETLRQQLLDRDVQLERLQKRYDELDSNYADDLDKVSFVDNLLVFLEEDKKAYHCYGCPQFQEPIDYKDAFICCDRKTARALGYTHCSFCCNSNSELSTED